MKRATVLSVSTALAAVMATGPVQAVRISPNGLGSALVYPYYTVQQGDGGPYNTYISVMNQTTDAKVLRVRFREGRASREIASFNLYLGPRDGWAGAIVPASDANGAARVITIDNSCTSPILSGSPAVLPFQNALYSGANDDGNGTGLDRTREGFVEILGMATLTGATATAVSVTSAGAPANCAATQTVPASDIAPPAGGLSGTETLINVASGLNFDMNAVALVDLGSRPYYRPAADPYPDFNAAEIDPVSVVVANGAAYRATWSRPVDAVSAVFMSTYFIGEYVLDDETASNTDVVATFPTRQFYVTTTSARSPFTAPVVGGIHWAPECQAGGAEVVGTTFFNRDERASTIASDCGFPECPPGPPPPLFCAATVVFDTSNGSPHTAITTPSRVLGSLVRGYSRDGVVFPASFTHGWIRATFVSVEAVPPRGLKSLSDSTRMDLATGAITTGPQTYSGLPVLGFAARTFVNGTLTCSAGSCQGNYGGAFPFQYIHRIAP